MTVGPESAKLDVNSAQKAGTSSDARQFKPKPLPEFKSILRDARVRTETTSLSKSIPDPAKILASLTLSEPSASPNPFQSEGKFSNAATDHIDTTEPDPSLKMFTGSSASSQYGSRIAHSKPKFKQVVREAKRDPALTLNKENNIAKRVMGANYDGTGIEDKDVRKLMRPLEVPGLGVMLLGHQNLGVRFMRDREKGTKGGVRGGILADDMGLGKTIQSIALILKRPPKKDAEAKTTLVVAPLAVLDQWKDEINFMAPNLKVTTHQGTNRESSSRILHSHDVVVTTYDTVVSESRSSGPLFEREWYRIICDEAHVFRNQETVKFSAMTRLRTVENGNRWVLTGTPIHNDISDLISLLKFLGVDYTAPRKLSDDNIKAIQKILKPIMLRRTQNVLGNVLPAIHRVREEVEFSESEQRVYYTAYRDPGIGLAKLAKLRLACDCLLNMSLQIEAASTTSNSNKSSNDAVNKSSKKPSSVSSDGLSIPEEDDMLSSLLGNLTLKNKNSTQSGGKDDDDFPYSDNSKVKAVRKVLLRDRSRKTVVFTSFLSMLAAVASMLEHEGINYEIYHGAVKAPQRQQILSRFKDPKEGINVLICTIQTAAVGLNLTAASRVIMADVWWNPQIVDQAIKRVHRLGQTHEVECVELYAKGHLEERMLVLQDRKRKLATDLIGDTDTLSEKERAYLMTEEDIPDEFKTEEDLKKEKNSSKETSSEDKVETETEIRPKSKTESSGESETKMTKTPQSPDVTSPSKNLKEYSARELPKIRKHVKFTE